MDLLLIKFNNMEIFYYVLYSVSLIQIKKMLVSVKKCKYICSVLWSVLLAVFIIQCHYYVLFIDGKSIACLIICKVAPFLLILNLWGNRGRQTTPYGFLLCNQYLLLLKKVTYFLKNRSRIYQYVKVYRLLYMSEIFIQVYIFFLLSLRFMLLSNF